MCDEEIKAQLSKLREVLASRQATNEARWEHQKDWNKMQATTIREHENRISAVERKVIWWSGFAAAAGSIAGWLLQLAMGK